MGRKDESPIEKLSRESLAGFNDLRFNLGVKGVVEKEKRAMERWSEGITGEFEDAEDEES